MSPRNARLNVRGRQLLGEQVCVQGWAVAHAARAQGFRVSARTGGSIGSVVRVLRVCVHECRLGVTNSGVAASRVASFVRKVRTASGLVRCRSCCSRPTRRSHPHLIERYCI